MRAGFTLVELAIVLVIIGLLVGGVLVGTDLIKSARINATLSQLDSFNAAVNTFRDKYAGLPGDLSVAKATQFGFYITGMTGARAMRDGNGFIEGYRPSGGSFYEWPSGETLLFWNDLSVAGLIPGQLGTNIASGGVASGNQLVTAATSWYPAMRLRDNLVAVVYSTSANTQTGLNFFQLIAPNASSAFFFNGTSYYFDPAIQPVEALAMDSKMDDGVPKTGIVQAKNNSGTTASYGQTPSASDGCITAAPSTYDVNSSNKELLKCTLSFRMQ